MENEYYKNNYFIIVFLIFITLIAMISNRFLYADGSAFFYNILSNQDFYVFDQSRLFAQYLTQFPIVFSIKQLGIENKDLLMLIYGGTLYAIPLFGVILSVIFLENKKLIIFPLLSFYFSSVYAYTFIISEAHMMASVFWVLIILITRKNNHLFHKILLILLLLVATHLYESYLFFSILLGSVTLYKIKINKLLASRFFYFICLIIILYGFFVAFESYLYPRDPTNAGRFTKSLIKVFIESSNLWIMCGIFISMFVIVKNKINNWLLPLFFIITFIAYFEVPRYIGIKLSYSARTLLTVIPFGFGLLFILFEKKLSYYMDLLYPRIMNSLIYITVFFCAFQLAITLQWYGYTQIFKTVLTGNYTKSVIDYRQTQLKKKVDSNQMINEFGWGWTYPFMSYALTNKSIFTIIENKNNRCCMSNPYSLITKISSNEKVTFKSKKIIYTSWFSAEKSHRWSQGESAIIKFYIDNKKEVNGILNLHIGTLGKQEIKLSINDNFIGNQTVNALDENLSFNFNPNLLYTDSMNTISFEFPDAHKPNNGDQRVLAMALKSFRIE